MQFSLGYRTDVLKKRGNPKTEVEIQTHQNSNADLARWYIGVCSLHNCSPVFCGGNYEGLLRSPVKPFQGGFACVYLGNRVPGYCLEVKIWLWYLKYIKMAQGKFQLLFSEKQLNRKICSPASAGSSFQLREETLSKCSPSMFSNRSLSICHCY